MGGKNKRFTINTVESMGATCTPEGHLHGVKERVQRLLTRAPKTLLNLLAQRGRNHLRYDLVFFLKAPDDAVDGVLEVPEVHLKAVASGGD